MQDFIKECKDMDTIQPELDKMKAEAEKNKTESGEVDVPATFGTAPEDAAEFKPVVLKSKKRDLQAMQKGSTEKCETPNVNEDNKENKIRKLNE